jgi:hypothetical protein
MNAKDLMREYLGGRLSAEELRNQLRGSSTSEAKEVLRLVQLDETGRKLLADFEPPAGAAERLGQKFAAAESWMEAAEQAREARPARKWLGRLSPAFDVAGHGLTDEKAAARKKKPGKAAKAKKKIRKRSRKPRRHR